MLLRNISRCFGKKRLFIWNNKGFLAKRPREMTDYIDGEVKSLSMGPNHSGIVTKCGKLYMLGLVYLFYY